MKKLIDYPILALLALSLLLATCLRTVRAQPADEPSLTGPSAAEGVRTNETATSDQSQRPRGFSRFGGRIEGMYKAQITPHWFSHNTRFWYRNDLRGGAKEFIVVDAEQGTRRGAFDHQKL